MGMKKGDRIFIYPLVLFVPVVMTFVFVVNHLSGEKSVAIKWIILGIIWLAAIAFIIFSEIEIRNKSKSKKHKTVELKILNIIDEGESGLLDIEVEYPMADTKRKFLSTYSTKNDMSELIQNKMREKGIDTIKTTIYLPKCKQFDMKIEDFLKKLELDDYLKDIELVSTGNYDYSKSVLDSIKN